MVLAAWLFIFYKSRKCGRSWQRRMSCRVETADCVYYLMQKYKKCLDAQLRHWLQPPTVEDSTLPQCVFYGNYESVMGSFMLNEWKPEAEHHKHTAAGVKTLCCCCKLPVCSGLKAAWETFLSENVLSTCWSLRTISLFIFLSSLLFASSWFPSPVALWELWVPWTCKVPQTALASG